MRRLNAPSLALAAGLLAACQSASDPQLPAAASPAEVRMQQRQYEQSYGREREMLDIERRQRQQLQGRGP